MTTTVTITIDDPNGADTNFMFPGAFPSATTTAGIDPVAGESFLNYRALVNGVIDGTNSYALDATGRSFEFGTFAPDLSGFFSSFVLTRTPTGGSAVQLMHANFQLGGEWADFGGVHIQSLWALTPDTLMNYIQIKDPANLVLIGNIGADTLRGSFLNDTLRGMAGADMLIGGLGSDTASYEFSNSGVIINLLTGAASGGHATGDKFSSIESIIGTNFADNITGDGGDNFIDGALGFDTIDGGAGNDFIFGRNGGGVLRGGSGNDRIDGGIDGDTIYGGIGNDDIRVGDGTNTAYGEDGIDTMLGASGNDILDGGTGVDLMSGGNGSDTYYVDVSSDSVFEFNPDLATGGNDLVNFTGISGTFILTANVERLTLGGVSAINGTGNNLSNTITGNAAGNILDGGVDTLLDTLSGGLGNDTYMIHSSNDNIAEVVGGGLADRAKASVSFTLAAGDNVEFLETINAALATAINLTGNEFAQTINGNNGVNVLKGAGGKDVLDGLAGVDTADFSDKTLAVVATLNGAVASNVTVGGVIEDSIRNVENLIGGTALDSLTGDGLANILNGGADALADNLAGALGNDTYIINSSTDNIIELAGGGTGDRAQASVSYALGAGDNIEVLETTNAAGTGALNLTGNEIAQTIIGNAGANTLNGGTDALIDTMTGGLGNDIYIINSSNDNITELAGGGTADRAKASVSFTLAAGDNIEFLETTTAAGVGAINLTGNEIAQTITGNAGANILNGGTDALSDILIGGLGNDTYIINSTNDDIVETAGGGAGDKAMVTVTFDLAAGDNIEFLQTTNSTLLTTINLLGNEIGQTITGNAGGNFIAGDGGNDTLTGALGNDIFHFNTALNAATNRDTITDFNVAADTIFLDDGIFAFIGAPGTVLAANLFKNLTTGGPVDADDKILYNDTTGAIFYDVDGSGATAAIQFATLTGTPTVNSNDFLVV